MVAMLSENERIDSILSQKTSELRLDIRVFRLLSFARINTVGQLARRQEDDLLKIDRLGDKAVKEINEKLWEACGLRLAMVAPLGPKELEALMDKRIDDALGPYCFTKFNKYRHKEMLDAFRSAGMWLVRSYLERRASPEFHEALESLVRKSVLARYPSLKGKALDGIGHDVVDIKAHFLKLIPGD